jgi:glyoxylase I family protein
MIKSLHHAGIIVSDMDRGLAFYRDILRLKPVMDFEISGEEWGAILGYPGVRARVVVFEEGVEMLHFFSPTDGKILNARPWDIGYTMLIMEVDDLDKTYYALQEKGVQFYAPSKKEEIPNVGIVKIAHMRAPEGVRICLMEFPKR